MNFQECRDKQLLFEDNLEGVDGRLADFNNPDFILRRGVIGEAQEAIDALEEYGPMSDEFRNEVVDSIIFIATLLNHIGMSNEEMERRIETKVVRNFIKYRREIVSNYSVEEGMKICKNNFSS